MHQLHFHFPPVSSLRTRCLLHPRTALIVAASCLFVSLLLAGATAAFAGAGGYLQSENQPLALVEVGGPFAGAEFHHSRPVPTRISFYSPVANSVDLSTDYWQRWESIPVRVFVTVDGA